MPRSRRLRALGLVTVCGLSAACTDSRSSSAEQGSSGDGESSASADESGEGQDSTWSEAGTDDGTDSGAVDFDPEVCGSWEDEPQDPGGELPPEATCSSPEACPQFTDVTTAAGIVHQQYVRVSGANLECIFTLESGMALFPNADCEPQWFSGGAAAADVDGDGWDDLFITRLGHEDKLYMNQGDGTFVDEAQSRGLGDCSFSNGVVFGDIDNDGDPDLLVSATGAPAHQLFINDGTGHFTEDADARGFAMIGEGLHGGEGIGLGDYDLDGWLDAHINEWIEPHNYPGLGQGAPAGSLLLHNVGGGVFEDVTDQLGVSLWGLDEDGIYGFSTAFADLDDDRWPELIIAADFRTSRMFWNEGGTAFSDGTDASGLNKESNAMGSTLADFDGDGRLDWFVTSIAEREDCGAPDPSECDWKGSGNRLYHNEGNRIFTRAEDAAGVRDAGWAWGSTFLDLDNDGDQDLMVVNGWPGRDLNGGFMHQVFPMRTYVNTGGGFMSDRADLLGANDTGQGRAIIPFDYDRDGDLDVFIANHAQPPRLYRNDGANQNAWLQVEVEGVQSNRDGRGAVLELRVDADGPVQRRQVGASSHFLGEPPLTQHFGLGPGVSTIAELRIYWPASDTEILLQDVEVNQRLTVTEQP